MNTLDEEKGRPPSRVEGTKTPKEDSTEPSQNVDSLSSSGSENSSEKKPTPKKWSLGILADKKEDEVPGSILLLSKPSEHNAPLGFKNPHARLSETSMRSAVSSSSRSRAMFSRHVSNAEPQKKTKDGKIILEPQPDESMNDPLNWSVFRRDAALLSLGFYCMLGGGMTTILGPGFNRIAETYSVTIPQVALTTGLYMMGLGLGSVIASPTAIAFGKRPVYLVASLLFLLTAIWCALSPNYPSLVVARVVQGLAVSPVECLPSATIAEIFFLHERAYRLGIYTMLLLGGKNLIPLVSATIIQSLDWRWVFWILTIILGSCFWLLFFFVPETFWERAPTPHRPRRTHSFSGLQGLSRSKSSGVPQLKPTPGSVELDSRPEDQTPAVLAPSTEALSRGSTRRNRSSHPHFHLANGGREDSGPKTLEKDDLTRSKEETEEQAVDGNIAKESKSPSSKIGQSPNPNPHQEKRAPSENTPSTVYLHSLNSPWYETHGDDYFSQSLHRAPRVESQNNPESAAENSTTKEHPDHPKRSTHYTSYYKSRDAKTFSETLRPYSGRLCHDNWFRVAARPFILFAYPSILWSAAVYALSVGWLIVLSESVATIYENPDTYNFDAIGTGLVYLSPFIGGVLGTAVAGKVSDIVVRYVSKLNDGIYEPEFRLIMAIPIAISTIIGLIGFGWSVQERDSYWVPTIFFGIISFGCTLGSTTAITFAVDSYRQFAGEALVTLNFSKNIFHGLVFSLFFNNWLASDGPKDVFIALGCIQLFFLLFTIPMYIFGKRARMWTVRKSVMEKF